MKSVQKKNFIPINYSIKISILNLKIFWQKNTMIRRPEKKRSMIKRWATKNQLLKNIERQRRVHQTFTIEAYAVELKYFLWSLTLQILKADTKNFWVFCFGLSSKMFFVNIRFCKLNFSFGVVFLLFWVFYISSSLNQYSKPIHETVWDNRQHY